MICSGPKGRGFESRHFDQKRNPGGVRLPGLFLFPAICGKAGENAEKLGEKLPGKSRKARRGNGSGMGEMGENPLPSWISQEKQGLMGSIYCGLTADETAPEDTRYGKRRRRRLYDQQRMACGPGRKRLSGGKKSRVLPRRPAPLKPRRAEISPQTCRDPDPLGDRQAEQMKDPR